MAPVGHETCKFEPPKMAATAPAMIAVMRPAWAPMPEVTPNARANGRATIATVRPASRSTRHDLRAGDQSFARGSSSYRVLSKAPRLSVGKYLHWRRRNAPQTGDRKSTRLNSSHVAISYAVFCLKKK